MVSSAFLYKEYPDKREGELTKLRASLVCEAALFTFAQKIGLGRWLRLGHGEEMGGGRTRPRDPRRACPAKPRRRRARLSAAHPDGRAAVRHYHDR